MPTNAGDGRAPPDKPRLRLQGERSRDYLLGTRPRASRARTAGQARARASAGGRAGAAHARGDWMSRRPTCRIPSCAEGAVYTPAGARWRVLCLEHTLRLVGRVGPALRMAPLEPDPPTCEQSGCRWPASALVRWGPVVGRRKYPPAWTQRCERHARELVDRLADGERYEVRRLPVGWSPPPDPSTRPTWRERRQRGRAA